MQYDKIAKSYKAQSVQTASPGKLVLMLFDGYLRFTTAAKRAFDETDFTKRNEGVNNNLIRAQNIVTELQSSLDMSVPGELLLNSLSLVRLCPSSIATIQFAEETRTH